MTGDEFDVVIAGGGMAGLLLAATLADSEAGSPLKIAIVDPKAFRPVKPKGESGEQPFDPRVVALTEASRLMLDNLGVWQVVAQNRCCPYRTMDVFDSQGIGRMQFDCAEVNYPSLGHIVENSLLVDGLRASLAERQSVTPITAVIKQIIPGSDQTIGLLLNDGTSLQTSLLVGADGAHSPVREMAGLAIREWDYGHRAIVTTIKTEQSHQHSARQWFSPQGPLAFLPLQTAAGESDYCSIVWSQHTDRAEQLMAEEDTAFCHALTQASEAVLGKVVSCDKRFSFPLHQRHAVDYVANRVVLIGDAAHTIHPLAGQGANLGFKDVQVLVDELNKGLKRGLDVGDELLLQRYQRRRKPDNLAMMALMEGFKRLFESESLALTLLRNDGMNYLNGVSGLKNMLVKQAMGL